jgi:GH18 family chitinase
MKTFSSKFKNLLGILLLLAAFNAQAQTKVIGYLPTWMNFPASVDNVDLTKITHINIAFANPNTSGVLSGVSTSDIAHVVNAAHAKNVKVSISIGGAGASASTYKTLLSSATNRTNFINNLVSYTTNNNLDGIDVDIEGDVLDGTNVTASQYQSFVTDLATALHAQNKIMTAALANWFADYVTNTAASKFDWINIMSYDGAIPGSGDAAGPHSTYAQATNDFNYWNTTKGVPGLKLTVGVPFYGYGWGTYATPDNDEISYTTIVNTYAGAETKDVVGSGSNAIYYNGIPTIKQKTTFAKQNAGGVMIWELAEDATGSKSLLLAIDQVMHPVTNTAPTVSITSPANNASFSAPASITINATATDDGSVSKVDFYNGSNLLGTDTSSPYSFSWTNVAAGTYSLTAKATDNTNLSTTSSAISVTVTGTVTQSPYGGTVRNLPGKIETEHYDLGGEGVAYHDLTTGNSGNAFRTDNVDLEATTDTGTGYNVGWIQAGEWLEYTVNITTAGTFTLSARVAATSAGKTFHVEMDGVNVSGTLTVPNTTGWQIWQTVTATTSSLTAGQKVMRIYADQGDFNINYVDFSSSVNPAPTTSITSPANGATFTTPATVNIAANAADTAPGTVSKVDFYNGSTLLGTDTSSPYTFSWTNVAAGTYTLTTKATDNQGAVTTSAAISITVNTSTNPAPTTSITSPANGATFTAPATVNIAANAADTSPGTVSKVDFYNGSTLLGTDTSSPYTFSWTNVSAGTYTLTTKATDNQGAVGTSAAISITVNGSTNAAPTTSITSPANGATFTAPASITISANASDDVSVSKVEFYNGSTLLGTDTSSPYSFSWTNVAAGTYSLTTKATDGQGLVGTSAAISITVSGSTGTCSGKPQYVENGGYAAGSQVQNLGSLYECKPYPYEGWCNGAAWAYAPGTGTYWADAWTLKGSCSARSAQNEVEQPSFTGEDGLFLSPNPGVRGKDHTVTLSFATNAGNVKVHLHDMNGSDIMTNSYSNVKNTLKVDMPALPSGLYIIRVQNEKKSWMKKYSIE